MLTGESGPDHDKHFTVEVHLNSNVIGKGGGRSKKEAEQQAAREALELMGLLRHANVALFVPHNGCPHQCSFLQPEKHYRAGRPSRPRRMSRAAAELARETLSPGCSAELAFFGGSFTGD